MLLIAYLVLLPAAAALANVAGVTTGAVVAFLWLGYLGYQVAATAACAGLYWPLRGELGRADRRPAPRVREIPARLREV